MLCMKLASASMKVKSWKTQMPLHIHLEPRVATKLMIGNISRHLILNPSSGQFCTSSLMKIKFTVMLCWVLFLCCTSWVLSDWDSHIVNTCKVFLSCTKKKPLWLKYHNKLSTPQFSSASQDIAFIYCHCLHMIKKSVSFRLDIFQITIVIYFTYFVPVNERETIYSRR